MAARVSSKGLNWPLHCRMQEVAKARSKVRLCIVEVAPGILDHAWITSDYLGSWWIISDYLGSCLTWQQVSNQH